MTAIASWLICREQFFLCSSKKLFIKACNAADFQVLHYIASADAIAVHTKSSAEAIFKEASGNQ
jgi:hypothetical protein